MAKEKKEQIDENEPYRMTAQQLFERSRSREIIPLTLSADIGLGGGIPLGCTVLLGGKPKCGKSSTSLQYAANAQRLYGSKVFYANIEGRLDSKILSQINGLDLNNFEVIMGPPIYAKDNKEEVLGHKKMSAQQWWKIIGETITNNPKSIIIVDSISSLSEEAELGEGMGYMSRAGAAKWESQFVRQYADLVVSSRITLFLLAQVIANPTQYGDPLQMRCGNAIKHAADCIIYIKSIEKWEPDSSGRINGQNMNWRIDCSSLGPPFITTSVPLYFGKGIDTARDICINAITWNLIKSTGAWYILPFKKDNLETIVDIPEDKEEQKEFIKLQGEDNVHKWLSENSRSCNLLEKTIREKLFV